MDLKQINETLNLYIRPQTFPLALRLYRSESELPETARMPLRDLGYQVTLCQAIGISSRYGWTLAVGNDDQLCVGGAVVMGFMAELPEGLPFPPLAAERCLEFGKYSHVVMAPIETAEFEPEVIAIFGSPAQVCRLVQAVLFPTGQPPSANIAGPAAGCGAIMARPLVSNECQFILHCGGDQMYGAAQDHEVIFTMPWDKVEAVLKGLEDTRKMGFGGYPIPVGITQRPTLPPILEVPKTT
jgi:uncharacterized protein (DUF169 family)